MTSPKQGAHQGPQFNHAPIAPLDMARALAAKGIPCFPCNGKRPIVDWKPYQTESPLLQQVESWWQNNPTANCALVTGYISGITVVDVDGCGHAPDVLPRILQIFGPTPLVVKTSGKGGGYQLCYKHNGERNSGTWQIEGFHGEIRAQGGYVMAAGSIHPDTGQPHAFKGDLTRFIECLKDLPITSYKPASSPCKQERFKPIQGQRDNWLFQEARTLASTTETLEELTKLLADLNASIQEPLADDIVAKTAKSSWKYKQSGTLLVAGCEPHAMLKQSDWRRLQPNEFYLLAMLKMAHSHRDTFAIGQQAVSQMLGWGKDRLKNAIRNLIASGHIVKVKQGGTTKGDCALYRWGTK